MKNLIWISFVFLGTSISLAAEEPQAQAPTPVSSASPVSARKTSISFEDEVVEGMNKTPLDSIEHIGQLDSDGQHLYRKRKSFKDQTPTLVREMEYGL